MKRNKKDEIALVIALNSTGPLVDKYPFGNKELTDKVKSMERAGLIEFNPIVSKWVRK